MLKMDKKWNSLIIATLLIWFNSTGCKSKTDELSVIRHEDGGIKAIGYVTDQKKNGLWREFSNDGELLREIEFEDDRWNGEVKEYRNGKLLWIENFRHDKREGYAVHYNVLCDFRASEGYYQNNERVGQWFYYHNGFLISIIDYKFGSEDTLYHDQNWSELTPDDCDDLYYLDAI